MPPSPIQRSNADIDTINLEGYVYVGNMRLPFNVHICSVYRNHCASKEPSFVKCTCFLIVRDVFARSYR
jgi:hypothetical protein